MSTGNGNSSVNGTNNAAAVRFNVGGTHYEVSRSLLAQYPDTMLSRMTSEIWLKHKDSGRDPQRDEPIVVNEEDSDEEDSRSDLQQDEPLFIDRDGERFRYVLDYMRDGEQVSLPATVSMEGLLKDMEYFGFQNVNLDNIKQNGPTFAQALKKVKEVDNSYFIYGTLARYCLQRIMFSGEYTCKIAYDHKDGEFSRRDHQHYNTKVTQDALKALAASLMTSNNTNERSHFDRCLEPCGLKLVKVYTQCNYLHYVIELIPK